MVPFKSFLYVAIIKQQKLFEEKLITQIYGALSRKMVLFKEFPMTSQEMQQEVLK